MKPTSPSQATVPDSELLADFLHELNLARRNLTLYPVSHPQVKNSSQKALSALQKLLANRQELSLGIAPDALFFEDQWLDKEQPTFRQVANFLAELGIASVSFNKKTSADELIQLCKLLHDDRPTIEELGGFEHLLEQHQIEQINIVPIDYRVFREKNAAASSTNSLSINLWEEFLRGLQKDILDLGGSGLHIAPKTIAELLNLKLAASSVNTDQAQVISEFIEQLFTTDTSAQDGRENRLNEFLTHLAPHLQSNFLSGALMVLEQDPELAAQILPELSPSVLERVFDPRLKNQLQNSPRLIELVRQLASYHPDESSHALTSAAPALNSDMIRARLEVLFSEEQHELYLPKNYQAALDNIFSTDISGSLPDEIRQELKTDLESQPVEQQCCAIIFELLEDPIPVENEQALQQNLLDLSYFFLETGHFKGLREIYQSWANYLHSGHSQIEILDDRVLASHTQQSFVQEIIDAIDIWGEAKATEIRDYIAAVGEPYTEPVIEQLGLAKQFSRRKYWIAVLSAIGTDANQLLIEALNDERWYLVRNLLTVLGKNLSPAALKAIQKMAAHPHPKVRQEVVRVLFAYNPATANRLLLRELANPNPEIRLNAIKIADLSRDAEVLGFLHQELQTGIDAGLDLEYKHQLLKTLARIGSEESLVLLKTLLSKKGLFTPKRLQQFHRDIIESIANYPHAKAEKTLRELAAKGARQHAKLAVEQLKYLRGETA